jgi:hypothetical protein
MNDANNPETIDQLVRHTLHTVAETLVEDASRATPHAVVTRKPHRRRRIALGVGATVVPLALAAAAIVREGPEYVDTIPPQDVVMRGSLDGSRYLLVESDRKDECGQGVTGVELVEERKNLLGSEWSTTGYGYGTDTETDCGHVYDTARYLKDPALFNASGAEVGDSMVWVYAVHPDVTAVRITSGDHTEDLKVYEVDGAGYALFAVPDGVSTYTSELLIDDRVVPGSAEEQTVRRP